VFLLPFVNGDLLSKSDIFQHDRFQHDRVLSFSEQPNQSKYPKQEGERVARLSLLIH
jgi:hypothetical protein